MPIRSVNGVQITATSFSCNRGLKCAPLERYLAAMFPAVQLALLALGAASCPSSLANDLATPAPAASRQLITVEAATSRATYATARAWARIDGPRTVVNRAAATVTRTRVVHLRTWRFIADVLSFKP